VFTGETDKLMELLLEGYDHILDVEDEENNHIFDVVQKRNEQETMAFLQSIPSFEVNLLCSKIWGSHSCQDADWSSGL
jgi:hypothetical protein